MTLTTKVTMYKNYELITIIKLNSYRNIVSSLLYPNIKWKGTFYMIENKMQSYLGDRYTDNYIINL